MLCGIGALGPTLANFFMANLENKLLQKESDTNPKLYLRYVDDIFAIFEDQRSSTTFLDLLNSQHKSIRFSMEKSNGTISFLDVEIKINPNGFDTWTWRKPTQTGLFLNFCAVCPKAWKEGLVLCLLHRAKAVCPSVKFFKTEVDNLRRLFIKNNYPIHFFNKILERFLHQLDIQTSTENEPDPKILFKVPFAGKISKNFFNNIRLIIKRKFGIHVAPLYTTTKVGHYFQLKNQTPSSLRSDVYKCTCSRDVSTTYIDRLLHRDI